MVSSYEPSRKKHWKNSREWSRYLILEGKKNRINPNPLDEEILRQPAKFLMNDFKLVCVPKRTELFGYRIHNAK